MPVNPSRNEILTPWTVLGLVLLCVIFGANAVAIKISFTGIGTFTSAGLRFALASVAITIWARLSGRRFRVSKAESAECGFRFCGLEHLASAFRCLGAA
jgi:drug/metabolite transporter (DMT)-like permease